MEQIFGLKLNKEEKEKRLSARRELKFMETHKEMDGIDHKLCNKCNEYSPANSTYYYLNEKNAIDGLYPYCKICAIKAATIWENENIEKKRASQRKSNKRPKAIHDQKINSKNQLNKGYLKNYYLKYPEKQKIYRVNHYSKKHDICLAEWESCLSYFENACAYCGLKNENHFKNYKGVPKLFDLHKEHADPEGANDLSNCVPSCHSCNSQKRNRNFIKWFCGVDFYSYRRLEKIINWLERDYKRYIVKTK